MGNTCKLSGAKITNGKIDFTCMPSLDKDEELNEELLQMINYLNEGVRMRYEKNVTLYGAIRLWNQYDYDGSTKKDDE